MYIYMYNFYISKLNSAKICNCMNTINACKYHYFTLRKCYFYRYLCTSTYNHYTLCKLCMETIYKYIIKAQF